MTVFFLPGDRVEVMLPRPFDKGFDYVVPGGMRLCPGSYVSVPFGPKELVGVVWGEGGQNVAADQCKPVAAHHSHLPPMADAVRDFIDWVAAYTLSPRGMVLKLALPVPDAIRAPATERRYALQHVEAGRLTPARKAVIEALQAEQPLNAATLKKRSGASPAVLTAMVQQQMLHVSDDIIGSARPAFTPRPAPALREEQRAASKALHARLSDGFSVTALEGVTGSGKTEVYFDVIETLLKQADAQVLVLLPEIALTTQWMQRFEARFGPLAALWHSSVSLAARKRTWQAVATGSAPLVVGARSALFLPFHHLSMIVVDEEHEASYKQEEGVLYHARDMAVARARHEAIPMLLCSATLSLETRANVTQGKYAGAWLHERHGAYAEPTPELIDLRADKPESGAFIAPGLYSAIAETLEAGHQAMLFLNRRGYAPLLLCRGCGHRFACHHCSAWMVRHARPARLQCHHCDWHQPVPDTCPACGGDELVPCGPGVERIAEEAAAAFPAARLAILSSDELALPRQLEKVIAGEADLIIGTQMIAKGHHFPALALVGVIDGDIGLEGGDLRAGERTYQLLHQLAGRAGREAVSGRVLIQTSQPEHPLMQALAAGDREGFMQAELAQREAGGWPPFGRLASLLLDGFNEAEVKLAAQALRRLAPCYDNIAYLGPAPAPISRARSRYRYRILVKAPKSVALQQIVQEWTQAVPLPKGVRLKIDIDPYQFL